MSGRSPKSGRENPGSMPPPGRFPAPGRLLAPGRLPAPGRSPAPGRFPRLGRSPKLGREKPGSTPPAGRLPSEGRLPPGRPALPAPPVGRPPGRFKKSLSSPRDGREGRVLGRFAAPGVGLLAPGAVGRPPAPAAGLEGRLRFGPPVLGLVGWRPPPVGRLMPAPPVGRLTEGRDWGMDCGRLTCGRGAARLMEGVRALMLLRDTPPRDMPPPMPPRDIPPRPPPPRPPPRPPRACTSAAIRATESRATKNKPDLFAIATYLSGAVRVRYWPVDRWTVTGGMLGMSSPSTCRPTELNLKVESSSL